ncbi:MAG: hypothetical protein AAFY71_26090 [Bacteroidota bacterium]
MNTRLQSVLLLISTLFVGIILGFLINGQFVKMRFAQHREMFKNPEKRLEIILDKSGLDDKKTQLIRPVLQSHFEKMHNISQQHRAEFRGQMSQLKEELLNYLSEEEVKKLGKEMRMFRKGRKHDHKGGSPHPPRP